MMEGERESSTVGQQNDLAAVKLTMENAFD